LRNSAEGENVVVVSHAHRSALSVARAATPRTTPSGSAFSIEMNQLGLTLPVQGHRVP